MTNPQNPTYYGIIKDGFLCFNPFAVFEIFIIIGGKKKGEHWEL